MLAAKLIKFDADAVDVLRSVSGRVWDPERKINLFPARSLPEIQRKFPNAILSPQIKLALEKTQERTANQRKHAALVEHIKGLPDAEIEGYVWETTPYPHQRVGVAFILTIDRCLLLDEMGLGKTKQAIDAACVRMDRDVIQRCLFIVPNSLKFNVEQEINTHAPKHYRATVVVDGPKKRRLIALEEAMHARFVVINYEAARLHINELKMIVDGQMLVCDEAHKIKNKDAQQTKAVQALKPGYAVLMTGTPVANKPEDVFTLVDYVQPKLLGKNYWDFVDRYVMRGGFSGKEVTGYRNLDDLRERIANVSIRRLKSEVLGLPPKTYQHRVIPMLSAQASAYEKMATELRTMVEDIDGGVWESKAPMVLTQLLRLQQITDGYLADTTDDGHKWTKWIGSSKLDALDEIVDDIVRNDGRKLLIWGRFVPVVTTITERYSDLGIAAIYGAVPTKERQAIVNRFQDLNDPLKIIVGQIQTASLGLTMTAADVEVFYDLSWSPSENLQAEDRLHRMGQKGTVSVIRLLCKETIDERMQSVLEYKTRVAGFLSGDLPETALKFSREEILGLLR